MDISGEGEAFQNEIPADDMRRWGKIPLLTRPMLGISVWVLSHEQVPSEATGLFCYLGGFSSYAAVP